MKQFEGFCMLDFDHRFMKIRKSQRFACFGVRGPCKASDTFADTSHTDAKEKVCMVDTSHADVKENCHMVDTSHTDAKKNGHMADTSHANVKEIGFLLWHGVPFIQYLCPSHPAANLRHPCLWLFRWSPGHPNC